MLALHQIATLDVSAASGLALRGDELVVIADDELALSRYDLQGWPRGRTQLFPGALPDDARARKRAKPDLEALAALHDGRLLALGSGSAPGRDRAALIDDSVIELDLGPLYDELRRRFDRLNVEGACVVTGEMVLLTRRTGRQGSNALVRLDLARLLAAFERRIVEPGVLLGIQEIDLGAISGTPLGFTDAAAWRDGLLYAAAAEVTDDPVEDGACVGCEIGWMDETGVVRHREPVAPCVKLEGIAISPEGKLFAVADADDRSRPAPLFSASLPSG